MAQTEICGVVLAAGKSSRMGFNKLIAPIAGHPLVWYAVRNLFDSGVTRVLSVVGHDRVRVKECIGEGVEWVVQDQQRGTGHAAAEAIPHIRNEKVVVVLFGDCPFLDADIIRETFTTHFANSADLTLATAKMRNPRFLGRVFRSKDGQVLKVADGKHNVFSEVQPGEVFAGLSVWSAEAFRMVLPELPERIRGEAFAEVDLPDAVEILSKKDYRISTVSHINEEDAIAPNQPIEFEWAAEYLRVKIRAKLMASGIVIPDPQTVRIDYDVKVAENTELRANSHLLGRTVVGKNCQIGPDATLRDCIVRDGCVIGKGSWKGQDFPERSVASDRLATEHLYFRRPHYLVPEDPAFAFVLMPFKEPFLGQLKNIIRPTLADAGYECKIASDRFGAGIIIEDIWMDINRAGLVVSEISEPNPNVWYELGLAHALNKPVLLLRKEDVSKSNIPFDIQAHRILIYSPDKGNLRPTMTTWLRECGLWRTGSS